MKYYGFPLSGNSHRGQALLDVLNVDYELVIVNLKDGEQKSPEFLKLNPKGQVPVLVDGNVVLYDSFAIMTYIGEKFDTENKWFPSDLVKKAEIQGWFSTAANEIQHGPFVLRAAKLFGMPADLEKVTGKTDALFGQVFEPHLADNDWLVGNEPSAADLACYGYIARVTEGNYDLDAYPAISSWLERIENIDGFPAMSKFK